MNTHLRQLLQQEKLCVSAQQRRRLLWVFLVLTPLGASLLARWGVHLSLWGCPSLHWVGIPCPAWGLTRSLFASARGDWPQALAFHAFGPVVWIGLGVAALHLGVEWVSRRRLHLRYQTWLGQGKVQLALLLLLFGYHGARLYGLAQSGSLGNSILQSPVGQVLTGLWH